MLKSRARTPALALTLLVIAATALADPGDGLDDRATILAAEMRRDSAALVPYLNLEPGAPLRKLAVRALGRIGHDGNGPGIVRDMLTATAGKEPAVDIADWYFAAGLLRDEELAEPLTAHLDARLKAKAWGLAAAAARALGWTGADGVADALVKLVHHDVTVVRVAALEGLARARAEEERHLVAAVQCAVDPDPAVHAVGAYAAWLVAGGYRRAQKKADPTWDGDAILASKLYGSLSGTSVERRLGGLRVLGILLPEVLDPEGAHAPVFALVDDPRDRVVEEAVSRIFGPREGEAVDAALARVLAGRKPKARHLAAQALGRHGTPAAVAALEARFAKETDARVREVLAVELVRNGKEEAAKTLLAREDRPGDPVLREITDVQLLLASKRPEALTELLTWADPGASQRRALHAATWWTILGGLEERDHPRLAEWLGGFLNGGYAIDREERDAVIAAAVGLIASKKLHAFAPRLLRLLESSPFGPPGPDLRSSLASAYAELAADEACAADVATGMKAAVRKLMDDPSPWVRRAARRAAKALALEDVPEFDEQQPNEWKGLPRAEEPIAGIDPAGDGAWLDEKEILQIAEWIVANEPRIVFETTAGTFKLVLDAEAAPVHAVSLFNAVRNGIYANTRWHRVVPSFVIQGGDPHGTGGGNGGWTVPDEISANPFVRGALGMPKSVKDDGGCQIFIMHSAYRPLNERYTCYGRVIEGMDTVDRIRVGDFITAARWEKP